jgi:outer membrane lipoprotein-sorting protein
MNEIRDEVLGAALRELEVPEHAPGFDAELERLLREEPRGRLAERRRARRSRPRWGLRLAGVAAAAAVALLAIGLARDERVPDLVRPGAATAAEIKAKVRGALASMRSMSGVVVTDGPRAGDEARWRFVLTADGDFRLAGPTEGEVVAYDASQGIARSASKSASAGGDTIFYAERRGVAPGPPDQGPPTWLLPREFGAVVRALLAAEDPLVRETVYDGRPAWRLDIDVVPNAIVPEFSGDRFQIVVDRETGIPVRVVETKGGEFRREIRIENLRVNAAPTAGAFTVAFPPGAEVMASDEGFGRVELAAVAGIAGYEPLVPAWVPAGYELAVGAAAQEAFPTGAEAGNPPSRMVVSLAYRRGLDRFLVTTRLALGASWDDPLATGEGFVDEPERIAVRRGALVGVEAELLIVPRGIPHVWALADDLVVTVGGDLSRAELIRVTESLRS